MGNGRSEGDLMANYNVAVWTSSINSLATVAAEVETKIDTIDTGKTLRSIAWVPVGVNIQAVVVYDA
jgi:hypothetical protein